MNYLSTCCNALVKVEGDETLFWRCSCCGKPCDAHVQVVPTSLEWTTNGELAPLDQEEILDRLCHVDPVALELLDSTVSQI